MPTLRSALLKARNALFSLSFSPTTPMAVRPLPLMRKYALLEPDGGSFSMEVGASPAHFSKSVLSASGVIDAILKLFAVTPHNVHLPHNVASVADLVNDKKNVSDVN